MNLDKEGVSNKNIASSYAHTIAKLVVSASPPKKKCSTHNVIKIPPVKPVSQWKMDHQSKKIAAARPLRTPLLPISAQMTSLPCNA